MMLLALGVVSSALEALQSLTSKSSSTKTALGTAGAASFDFTGTAAAAGTSTPASGSGSTSQLAPQTLSALIAAQGQSGSGASASASRSDPLQDLFSLINSDHSGQITKDQFEQALGAGGTNLAQADDVFNKLDTNGDDTVSLDELSKALKGAGHHHHHHAAGAGGTGSDTDPLLQALAGASGNSVSNSDGSTTTSLTYADGSKVTLTTPAASSTSGSATKSYNLVEQLIQREAQAISTNASLSLSA